MLYNKADPGAAAKKLISIGFEHYRKFWQLRKHFRKEDTQLFQLTAKAHHNCHACLLSVALNPRHRVSTQNLSSKVWSCLKSIRLVCLSRSVYTCIYLFPVMSSHVRLSWCYKWEDFMGVCRDLASSCKQSGHGVAFCKRLFEKYTYLLLVKIYIFLVLDPVGPFNQLGAIFAYRLSKWLSVNWEGRFPTAFGSQRGHYNFLGFDDWNSIS